MEFAMATPPNKAPKASIPAKIKARVYLND
jgi:hypothetical protein